MVGITVIVLFVIKVWCRVSSRNQLASTRLAISKSNFLVKMFTFTLQDLA